MIKDSGNRTEFNTGAVRDIQEGKGRMDLVPFDIVARLLDDDCLLYLEKFQKDGDYIWLIDAVMKFVQYGAFNGSLETAVLEYSIHLEEGAEKYSERNWEKGIPLKNYINSAARHYVKYLRGDDDERHDRAFVWNCLCGAWTALHHPELNEYLLNNK